MQLVDISAPAWQATMPRRIALVPDEWLHGFLLCRYGVNRWTGRTTLHNVLHMGPEKFLGATDADAKIL